MAYVSMLDLLSYINMLGLLDLSIIEQYIKCNIVSTMIFTYLKNVYCIKCKGTSIGVNYRGLG